MTARAEAASVRQHAPPGRRRGGHAMPHCAPTMPTTLHFALRGDHITLDALLKATGLADSGGQAKGLIAAGAVQVNGQPETRRGRKLRAGDAVQAAGQQVLLQAAGDSD